MFEKFQNILKYIFCLFANFYRWQAITLGKGEMLWLAINMESDFIMQNLLIVKIKAERKHQCYCDSLSGAFVSESVEK